MQFHNLRSDGAAYRSDVMNLYHSAFPEEEKKPEELIKALVLKNRMELFAITESNEWIGLLFTQNAEAGTLLDFFAIRPDLRGKGNGGKALDLFCRQLSRRPLILEIEDPDPQADHFSKRLRRKQFYLRHGMRETGIHIVLFAVRYELLCSDPNLTYDHYYRLMEEIHGKEIRKHLHLA